MVSLKVLTRTWQKTAEGEAQKRIFRGETSDKLCHLVLKVGDWYIADKTTCYEATKKQTGIEHTTTNPAKKKYKRFAHLFGT